MEVVYDQPEDSNKTKKRGSKKGFITAGIIIIALVALFGLNMFFVAVPENYSVSIKRFDKVITVYEAPGLYFKLPIDTAVYIRNNAIIYNLSPSDVLTLDKKAMTVSSYAVWQIVDPLRFLQTAVTQGEAERRIDATVYNAIKNLLGSVDQMDIIRMRGRDLETKLVASVTGQLEYYGVKVLDIRIKQFDLPADNKNAVYARMISERAKIAAQYRAEGQEEADKIRNVINTETIEIESAAKAQGAQLEAEGESEYMRILAEAYNGADRAYFYEFIRTLDALKVTMQGDKTIILPIDSPLTKVLMGISGGVTPATPTANQ